MMSEPLKIDVITIFPQMLDGFLSESMMKRAIELQLAQFNVINLRDFTDDKHRTTDDRPFGGGPGMVMMAEPIFKAVESVKTEASEVILMSPQGKPFSQAMARELTQKTHLILICGHYEGVDERVRTGIVDREISIGDYVLTNGVLPAAVVLDAVVRLRPGVLGAVDGAEDESFSHGLLEYPQYTRPAAFRGMTVPDVLRSGNHEEIAAWRKAQAEKRTRDRRPDLLSGGEGK